MSRDNAFDLSELDDFTGQMMRLANKQFPKEFRKFIRIEGNKLRKVTVAKARQSVKKKTGTYVKSIKRGKVYKYDNGLAIRVYTGVPHAHLIEYGHRIVTKGGREKGFVPGQQVFAKARKSFEGEFVQNIGGFVDELLEKGLRR
ncbi:HK97 gp10 family phage protein [Paenibacillus taichungensis]|uniref:HK97 gp10 family phage protein n=1 Tax=Paenibacillus taichungensis TaxID=484184 RepID=UPI002DB9DA2C|nr:HK97 gp10 family phage protein [Paenibacillus taichungensis]MEC0107267.1 HK97 gp10 family phage protein [Paenibacillus taichungensis]MEC0194801.1 HK97 gp10 family phage protein [Paenibacillus taichungensis]